MKLPEENIREMLQDTVMGKDVFIEDTKSTANKSKTRQTRLYQSEKLLYQNETINTVKRQYIDIQNI
jgi:hypothetical protein